MSNKEKLYTMHVPFRNKVLNDNLDFDTSSYQENHSFFFANSRSIQYSSGFRLFWDWNWNLEWNFYSRKCCKAWNKVENLQKTVMFLILNYRLRVEKLKLCIYRGGHLLEVRLMLILTKNLKVKYRAHHCNFIHFQKVVGYHRKNTE